MLGVERLRRAGPEEALRPPLFFSISKGHWLARARIRRWSFGPNRINIKGEIPTHYVITLTA